MPTAALLLSVAGAPVLGQNADAAKKAPTALDASKCTTRSGEEAIVACSMAIKSGKYSGKNLSILYSNRSAEYKNVYVYDKAIEDATKAIELDPSNATAFNNRCSVYSDTNEYDRAITDCTEAIRLKPDVRNTNTANQGPSPFGGLFALTTGYNPFYNRGIAWRGKKDYQRAIADFTEAIKRDPTDAAVYHNRGMSLQAIGEYDRAIADETNAIRLRPGDFKAYFTRGRTWAAKGQFRRAISDYDEAIKRSDFNQLYRARGAAHYALGEYSAAAEDLRHSLERGDNAWVMIWRYLARARLSQNGAPELSNNSAKLDKNNWPYPAIDFFLGRRSLESMRSAAKEPLDKCEAEFYAGEWYSLHDKLADAKKGWQSAVDICRRFDNFEYEGAVAQLKRVNPAAAVVDREPKTQTDVPTAASADCAQAETHWKSAEAMGTRDVYEDHLKRFANCAFATLAKARILSIDQKGRAPNSPSPMPEQSESAPAPTQSDSPKKRAGGR